MAINIQPEEQKRFELPNSFNVLFYYSIILLLLVLSTYGLLYQWNSKVKSRIATRSNLVSELEKDTKFQENKAIISEHQKLLEDYTSLFLEKNSPDSFFFFLESALHPMAHLKEVAVDVEEKNIRLNGFILNYNALEQQYAILKDFRIERSFWGWIGQEEVLAKQSLGELEYQFRSSYNKKIDALKWEIYSSDGELIDANSQKDLDRYVSKFSYNFPEEYKGEEVEIKISANYKEEEKSGQKKESGGFIKKFGGFFEEESTDFQTNQPSTLQKFVFQLPKQAKKEQEESELLVNEAFTLYKSPINRTEVVSVDLENYKVLEPHTKVGDGSYLSDVSFERDRQRLVRGNWYEVVIDKEIAPIKEVDLVKVDRRSEEEMNVAFEFDLNIDPIIFHP